MGCCRRTLIVSLMFLPRFDILSAPVTEQSSTDNSKIKHTCLIPQGVEQKISKMLIESLRKNFGGWINFKTVIWFDRWTLLARDMM